MMIPRNPIMATRPLTSSALLEKKSFPFLGTPLKTGMAVARVKVKKVKMMGIGAALDCSKTLRPVANSAPRAAKTPSMANLLLATSGIAPANLHINPA